MIGRFSFRVRSKKPTMWHNSVVIINSKKEITKLTIQSDSPNFSYLSSPSSFFFYLSFSTGLPVADERRSTEELNPLVRRMVDSGSDGDERMVSKNNYLFAPPISIILFFYFFNFHNPPNHFIPFYFFSTIFSTFQIPIQYL